MIKIFMEGRVAQDAKVFEYGTGRNAKTGVSFGLICNRFYNDENPTYMQCTIWSADEKLAQHITTGKQLIIDGTLTRNEEGYYSTTVNNFSFGSAPRGKGNVEDSTPVEKNYGNKESYGRPGSDEGYVDIPYNGRDEELPFN